MYRRFISNISSPSSEDNDNLKFNTTNNTNNTINSINTTYTNDVISPVNDKVNALLKSGILQSNVSQNQPLLHNSIYTIPNCEINLISPVQNFNPILNIHYNNNVQGNNNQGDFRKKFKTEICKFYELNQSCKYGDKVIIIFI